MIQTLIYWLSQILAMTAGIFRIKDLDKASRLWVFILFQNAIMEVIAYKVAMVRHENLIVYNTFAPLQLFMTSLYYNLTIKAFQKKNIGIMIGVLGIIVATFNVMLFPAINAFSYYLVFEGFCVISMSLWSFIDLIKNDQWTEVRFCHFLFSSIQLFFWTATYFIWASYTILSLSKDMKPYINFLMIVNHICYFSFTLVFLIYPKKLPQNG